MPSIQPMAAEADAVSLALADGRLEAPEIPWADSRAIATALTAWRGGGAALTQLGRPIGQAPRGGAVEPRTFSVGLSTTRCTGRFGSSRRRASRSTAA